MSDLQHLLSEIGWMYSLSGLAVGFIVGMGGQNGARTRKNARKAGGGVGIFYNFQGDSGQTVGNFYTLGFRSGGCITILRQKLAWHRFCIGQLS